MSLHRFFVPPDQCHGATLTLKGREAHHALHVLRVRRGEQVIVLDGAGQQCLCEVRDCGRDSVGLSVLERETAAPVPYQLTLVQAVPKGKLIEAIIQRGTELGVHRIVPLLSERVVARFDTDEAKEKAEKWQAVAVEAIKQCGAAWLPRVETPQSPQAFSERKEHYDLALVGSLQPGSKHPRECFREFEAKNSRKPKTVCVWVGPEGDFTPAELAAIQAAGALPITLGPLVLRAETAAVYCMSVISYELQ
jgi:16S rRNA (uracil1498-N3)-methyltransferase